LVLRPAQQQVARQQLLLRHRQHKLRKRLLPLQVRKLHRQLQQQVLQERRQQLLLLLLQALLQQPAAVVLALLLLLLVAAAAASPGA
jgi:hypothetical protein